MTLFVDHVVINRSGMGCSWLAMILQMPPNRREFTIGLNSLSCKLRDRCREAFSVSNTKPARMDGLWSRVAFLITLHTLDGVVAQEPISSKPRPAREVDIADVGPPFDVKSFSAFTLPDDRNAIRQYLRAGSGLVNLQTITGIQRYEGALKSADDGAINWKEANADVRRWLEANRSALALWKIGTEFADAIEVPFAQLDSFSLLPACDNARGFVRLALLEASRLYVKSLPADPFGKGEPIHYRLETTPRQQAIVWSVGPAKDVIFRFAAPR
jgi:hypothetical protein